MLVCVFYQRVLTSGLLLALMASTVNAGFLNIFKKKTQTGQQNSQQAQSVTSIASGIQQSVDKAGVTTATTTRRDELFQKMAEFGKQGKLTPTQFTERMITNRLYMVYEELVGIEENQAKLKECQAALDKNVQRLTTQIKAGLDETNDQSFKNLENRIDLKPDERTYLVSKAKGARSDYERLAKEYNNSFIIAESPVSGQGSSKTKAKEPSMPTREAPKLPQGVTKKSKH